jgi:Fe2+ transport system protein FeoA
MTHIITVPDYITNVNEAVAYIRKRLIELGIDPDSIRPEAIEDQVVMAAPRSDPFLIEMRFDYNEAWEKNKHLFYKESVKPKKNPVTMSYQQGFVSVS